MRSIYVCICVVFELVFFFKQKTAYEMRISDWSSDVCSSDLAAAPLPRIVSDASGVVQRSAHRMESRSRSDVSTTSEPGFWVAQKVTIPAARPRETRDRKSVV